MSDGPLAPAVESLLEGRVRIMAWDSSASGAEIAALYTYGHPHVGDELLDRLPAVRVISNYGVGVDHIDLSAASARRIPVGNTPGILDGATADMAMTLLLAAARRLIEGDRYARSPQFTVYDPGCMLGREVHHATLGIVGLGRIGAEIARRARGFEMKILYFNRRPREDADRLGAKYVSFDELLRSADFVVVSTPLTPETRGLIDARALSLMKRTAILVNVSRGPVVDSEALTDALVRQTIYAAALDVTDPEPLPRGHPLLGLNNLVISPHLGSATIETRQKMAEISVENLLRGLNGQPLLCAVART
jgi:glyoxylate reductase